MSDRITQLEDAVAALYRTSKAFAQAGLDVSLLGKKLEQKVALNTATNESFERTIADMQAQIDRLLEAAETKE